MISSILSSCVFSRISLSQFPVLTSLVNVSGDSEGKMQASIFQEESQESSNLMKTVLTCRPPPPSFVLTSMNGTQQQSQSQHICIANSATSNSVPPVENNQVQPMISSDLVPSAQRNRRGRPPEQRPDPRPGKRCRREKRNETSLNYARARITPVCPSPSIVLHDIPSSSSLSSFSRSRIAPAPPQPPATILVASNVNVGSSATIFSPQHSTVCNNMEPSSSGTNSILSSSNPGSIIDVPPSSGDCNTIAPLVGQCLPASFNIVDITQSHPKIDVIPFPPFQNPLSCPVLDQESSHNNINTTGTSSSSESCPAVLPGSTEPSLVGQRSSSLVSGFETPSLRTASSPSPLSTGVPIENQPTIVEWSSREAPSQIPTHSSEHDFRASDSSNRENQAAAGCHQDSHLPVSSPRMIVSAPPDSPVLSSALSSSSSIQVIDVDSEVPDNERGSTTSDTLQNFGIARFQSTSTPRSENLYLHGCGPSEVLMIDDDDEIEVESGRNSHYHGTNNANLNNDNEDDELQFVGQLPIPQELSQFLQAHLPLTLLQTTQQRHPHHPVLPLSPTRLDLPFPTLYHNSYSRALVPSATIAEFPYVTSSSLPSPPVALQKSAKPSMPFPPVVTDTEDPAIIVDTLMSKLFCPICYRAFRRNRRMVKYHQTGSRHFDKMEIKELENEIVELEYFLALRKQALEVKQHGTSRGSHRRKTGDSSEKLKLKKLKLKTPYDLAEDVRKDIMAEKAPVDGKIKSEDYRIASSTKSSTCHDENHVTKDLDGRTFFENVADTDSETTELRVARCGHVYCQKCIETHIKQKKTCPVCNQPAQLKQLYPLFL